MNELKIFSKKKLHEGLVSIVPAAVLLLFLAACAPLPPVDREPEVLSPQEWQALLEPRAAHWESYEAALRLRGENPRGRFAFRSLAVADLPHRFRLDAFNPLGHGVALLTVNTTSTHLWLPGEQTVYTSREPEPLLREMLGVSFPFESLPYLMAAAIPPDHLASLEWEATADGWNAVRESRREGVRYTYHFISQPLSLSAVTVRRGLWVYEVQYDPPVEIHREAVPKRVALSGIDWTMEVTVEKMEGSRDLTGEVFMPSLPEGTRAVEYFERAP